MDKIVALTQQLFTNCSLIFMTIGINRTKNLSVLTQTAKSTAKFFYEAAAIYYASLKANNPEYQQSFALKQCIFLGNRYRVALYQLLNLLEPFKSDEETNEIAKVKESIERLEAELFKLNKATKI